LFLAPALRAPSKSETTRAELGALTAVLLSAPDDDDDDGGRTAALSLRSTKMLKRSCEAK
jgi:hypothetical protein